MRRDVLVALAIALAAAALPQAALRFSARPLLLDFGPNDQDYVRGFRQDWERDGRTRFHWTTQAANVRLPLRIGGEGPLLRLRFRRHFVEPASVRLTVEGRTVAAFEAQADARAPYRVLELALPELLGRQPFVLSIDAPSSIDRPLGIALDWMELERRPGTRASLLAQTLARAVLAALAAFLLPRLAGAPRGLAAAHAAALIALSAWGARIDAIAFERIVREGLPAYLAVGCAAVCATLVFSRQQDELAAIERSRIAGALVVLALTGMAVRETLLLHPRFFYADVRVHAAMALLVARRGFAELGSAFLESQFRLSLGLQQVGEHWYAFPYPPGFYVLAAPLIAVLGYRPEVAVSLLAAAVNSLEALLVFVIARQLGLSPAAAVASGAVVPLLPLFLARLTLGYFPALFGHAFDALVLAWLLARRGSLTSRGSWLSLAALLALAFLAYTQSALNLLIVFGLFCAIDLARERSRAALSRTLALALAFGLAGVIAFGAFYFRYLPMLDAMRSGQPVPQERVLLERLEREEKARVAIGEPAHVEEADPYTGPDFDLFRGLRKAGWRLYVFYGAFAVLVVWGFVRLALSLPSDLARIAVAWGLTYVVLNLLSGSLPGPNLVRYNKDLEIVAPLVCLSLASVGFRLAERAQPVRRALAIVLAIAWTAFGVSRAAESLRAGFSLER